MVPKTERFEMRLDEETLARIDEWRGEQDDLPSRAEGIRRLVESGLARESRDVVRFSDGEKLLLLMMRDLFRHMKPKGAESDPDFIAEMIFGGHYWAASWKLPGVFHGHQDDPRNVRFVVDVLDMWNFIERGHEKLSDTERAKVETDAAPFGKHVQFMGFDGNNEAELIGIAHFLVEKLDRFTRFADRELNAHMPTRESYARMLRMFEPMRKQLIGQELNASQITALLLARRHPEHA
jgi:uncharacterized protein YfbU (UPF0304 family)